MWDARVVSNYFVELASKANNTLTTMQVLKLVYIAHGFHYGFFGTPLIRNKIEAWKYGPVIPELYRDIKHRRNLPIEKLDVSGFTPLDDETKDFISGVYDAYCDYDGIQLSALTHQPGTPWDTVYDAERINISIPADIIQHYYKGLAEQHGWK